MLLFKQTMNITTYIADWIQKMIISYPWICFKYEYSAKRKIHYVGVYPRAEVETNEAYCNDENLFAIDLDSKYPEQTVLFGSDETFYKFTDKANFRLLHPELLMIKAKDLNLNFKQR